MSLFLTDFDTSQFFFPQPTVHAKHSRSSVLPEPGWYLGGSRELQSIHFRNALDIHIGEWG